MAYQYYSDCFTSVIMIHFSEKETKVSAAELIRLVCFGIRKYNNLFLE